MKHISVALFAVILFAFGCTTTTRRNYSADFNAYPMETKDAGTTHINPDGETFVIPQNYRFECVLKETLRPSIGIATTRIVSSPVIETGLGCDGRVGVTGEGTESGGSTFEVKFEEKESEFLAHLTATHKEAGSKRISISKTITIQK